jgi:sRNA-binding regulator protein Hfq
MERPYVLTRHEPDHRKVRSHAIAAVSGGKKSSPNEKTFAEEFYYRKQMHARTPMVIRLVDGEELRGSIEWYDRDCVKVNRENAPNLLLMKRYIVYMYKAQEERSSREKAS